MFSFQMSDLNNYNLLKGCLDTMNTFKCFIYLFIFFYNHNNT